jgi:hypothetical protein
MYLAPAITAKESQYLSSKNTGLGNVMFQIAGTEGLSAVTDRRPCYNRLIEFGAILKERFGFHHKDTIFRNCVASSDVDNWEVVCEHAHKQIDQGILDAINTSPNNLILDGYIESPMYFLHIAQRIRDLFRVDSESLKIIQTKYPFLFDPTKVCVSVHVRTGRDANTRCGVRYYARAIRYILDRVPNAHFVVISDGDTRDIIRIPHTRIEGNEDYIDLWVSSFCTHNITTYSTFSWWGSFLNEHPNKIVTYPLSALKFIARSNGQTAERIHQEYFLSAVCIEDTQ